MKEPFQIHQISATIAIVYAKLAKERKIIVPLAKMDIIWNQISDVPNVFLLAKIAIIARIAFRAKMGIYSIKKDVCPIAQKEHFKLEIYVKIAILLVRLVEKTQLFAPHATNTDFCLTKNA